jgi:beta-N-acetylhexosaminidase
MNPITLPLGPVMLDVQGLTVTADERKTLAHPLVGGVILFARNFESREQLIALTTEIHAIRTPALIIAVDHEGGRVQRFKDGFTLLPAMRKLGELWMKDALLATKVASSVGYVLAAELRLVGIDFSFAPVLDLDYGESSVIGDRAFHGDARIVAMLAKSLMHGMAMAGMGNCGKHFPGHGFVKADSHHEVPTDKRSIKAILKADAAPYDWIGSPALKAVMPAHVIYPKVDPNPAGFSSKWLKEILRQQLRFDGAIFSDDLSMEAAAVAGDVEDRARAALQAGCDMVLVCNAPETAARVLEHAGLVVNAESSRRITALVPSGDLPSAVSIRHAIEEMRRGLGR